MSITNDVVSTEADLISFGPASPAPTTGDVMPAHFNIDLRNEGVGQLSDFAFYDTVLSGSHPHVWAFHGPLSACDERTPRVSACTSGWRPREAFGPERRWSPHQRGRRLQITTRPRHVRSSMSSWRSVRSTVGWAAAGSSS